MSSSQPPAGGPAGRLPGDPLGDPVGDARAWTHPLNREALSKILGTPQSRVQILGLGVVGVGTAVMSLLVLHRWVDDMEAGYCSAVSESPGRVRNGPLGGLSTGGLVRPDPGR